MEKKFIFNNCGIRIKDDTDISINEQGVITHMKKDDIKKIVIYPSKLILFNKDNKEFVLKYFFYEDLLVNKLINQFKNDTIIEDKAKNYRVFLMQLE